MGCADPPSDYGPVQADVIADDPTAFEDLWETILRVLRRADLRPDRQDRREGIITTFPVTSQQWFEFWRNDAMGAYQWAESSMQTVQRQAVVRIRRLPEPGRYRVTVKVDVFRFSTPERQVTTPSGALAMFSSRLPTEQGELAGPAEGAHWVHLGRDPRMEGALLRRILVHYPGRYELISEPDESIDDLSATRPAPASEPAGSETGGPVPGP